MDQNDNIIYQTFCTETEESTNVNMNNKTTSKKEVPHDTYYNQLINNQININLEQPMRNKSQNDVRLKKIKM